MKIEKIIFDIWQHSFINRLYLLQSTYESKIKNAVGSTFSKSQLYAFSQYKEAYSLNLKLDCSKNKFTGHIIAEKIGFESLSPSYALLVCTRYR